MAPLHHIFHNKETDNFNILHLHLFIKYSDCHYNLILEYLTCNSCRHATNMIITNGLYFIIESGFNEVLTYNCHNGGAEAADYSLQFLSTI